MTIAAEHDRTIGLSVTAGIYAPQWVYDAGATKYKLLDGSGDSMPLPWDNDVPEQVAGFCPSHGRTLRKQPDSRLCRDQRTEPADRELLSSTSADDAALEALGGIDAWVAAAEKIIGVYATSFPTTPFFITASRVFTDDFDNVALSQVIEWGVATYPGRFGIMTSTLNADSSTTYYPNEAINTYKDTQPVGFQMLCSSIKDPKRLGGTLDEALLAGIGLGGEFVEVYPKRCRRRRESGRIEEGWHQVGEQRSLDLRSGVQVLDLGNPFAGDGSRTTCVVSNEAAPGLQRIARPKEKAARPQIASAAAILDA